jgi:hypothetical protein
MRKNKIGTRYFFNGNYNGRKLKQPSYETNQMTRNTSFRLWAEKQEKGSDSYSLIKLSEVERQKSQLSKTMGRQVAKMSHLWDTVRSINQGAIRSQDEKAERGQTGLLLNFFVCLLALLTADLSVKALMLKMAHVVGRKKVAFQQRRQANKKIEQQTRLLGKKTGLAKKRLSFDDNPVACVPKPCPNNPLS